MNSEQEFKCIFCSETFQEKEALQVHFRKHGDPNFKSNQGDEGNSVQRSKDQMEIVECDVCPEVFTSISKAITHKHKLHPDHDAKYFCPWCGKLFTMKHLYNKHIHTNHPEIEKKHDKYFPCDSCNVAFTVPAAMMYHNKFFHRQDTDLPSIGTSKKLKIFNQEVVQIYYCPFCGEEYENKVNLHKHIGDDHSDENQSPEDILRCPLCDAVFYHLDAYELHLTYHSIEDMYSERNEMADQITDFSLESVPPMAEKVENLEETPGGDDDNDKIGIEQLLEFAMEEPKDKKSKKHKKHKKSKKPAITLDEFFNMNKDVFGEEIDFQGVEEVPTTVVKKRLKAKKSVPAKLLSPDLEKLKKQGIVVKKKPGRRIPLKKGPVKMTQHVNTLSNKPPMKSEVITNKLSTSEEVISKLLNQGNSQIKIVKKPNTNNLKPDNNVDNLKQEDPCKTTVSLSTKNIDSIANQSEIEAPNLKPSNKEHQDNETDSSTQEQDNKENQTKIIQTENSQTLLEDNNQDNNYTDTATEMETDECSVDTLKLLKNNANIVIKSNKHPYQAPSNVPEKNNVINEQANKKVEIDVENKSHEDIENYDDADEIGEGQNNTKNNSLNVLKHLSHLTVKSNKTIKSDITKENPEIRKYSTEQNGRQTKNAVIIKNEPIDRTAILKNDPIQLPTKHTAINKNKPIPLPFREEIDYQGTHEDGVIKTKPIVDKITTNKVSAALKNPQLTVQTRKSSPQKASLKDNIATDTSPSSLDLIKHLKNVTAKPINKNPTVHTSQVSPNVNVKQELKPQTSPVPKKIEENIEIVDIDDSDSDEGQCKKKDFRSPKTVNAPSNIKTSHVTVQSLNQSSNDVKNTILQIKKEPVDEDNDEYFEDNLNIIKTTNIKKEPAPNRIIKRINDSSQDKNLPLNDMLKNLSKNITIKSRNSSPQNVKNQNIKLLQDFDSDDAENDADFNSSKVKITEVENTREDDLPQISNTNSLPSNNVKVQYPDDSESDHDGEAFDKEFDEQFSDEDIESQIKATTMIKQPPVINKPPVNHNLNSLQKLGKNITIKSNKQVKIINDNPEPTSSQDDTPPFAKNLNKQILKKNISQANNKNNEVSKIVNNTTNMEKGAVSSTNQLINQNTMSNQVETKEVKRVKTFKTDTQTVIEEITTTVTKTIKTVNQTTKQETHQQSASNNPLVPRMQPPSQIPSQRNYQGVKVRQATPIITPNKIRSNLVPPVRVPCNVRPGNQIVPARPRFNAPRMIKPRMAGPRCMKIAAAAAQRMQGGTPVRTVAVAHNTAKRQNTEESPAHFSCFKKPKESLIPVSDVPIMKNLQDPSIQYSSVQMNKSNYSCTTSAVKGNSVVTSTQMRSESSASSQHLSKLQSMSGLSVVKASQVKQAVVEEKSEISASQKNTLDAIQRLQSQGLLIKKPRIDLYTENEYSDPGSDADDAGHYHDDE